MDIFSPVPAVAPHVAHVVAHVKPVIHTIFSGVTYMQAAIASGVSLLAGFGLGWYVKGRGMTGVQIDINNIKNEIIALKNKIDPPTVVVTPAPVVVSAPVATV